MNPRTLADHTLSRRVAGGADDDAVEAGASAEGSGGSTPILSLAALALSGIALAVSLLRGQKQ